MYAGLLAFLLLSWSGAVAGQAAELSLDPLLSFITCLRESRPGYCLRERALGYFEHWITGDDEDDQPASAGQDDDPGERLSPYWKSMVDTVAERIAGFYGEDEEEEEGKNAGEKAEGEERKSTELEGESSLDLSRGHHKKKKKIKAIKKAIIKLVLIALLIKSKLKMLLTAFQTFLQFKAVALATILVLIHAAKLWVEIKHKHHPQKVIYYENAHHQHHYDHHDDHDHWEEHGGGGGGWSLWGRSGLEAPTTTPIYTPYLDRAAHDLPYSAHVPAKQ